MAILNAGSRRPTEQVDGGELRSAGNSMASELQRRIAEEAYRLSELRGFESGFEDQDWIAAKRLVMQSVQAEQNS